MLHKISNPKKNKKRRGRGNSSGRGNYAGRGLKGQKARSGGRLRPGFEGGQTPYYMRIPKVRGFRSIHDAPAVVNVGELQKKFQSGDQIDKKTLKNKGLVKNENAPVKILGDGEFKKKMKISADSFSKKARSKIKAAGGEAVVLKKEEDKQSPAKKAQTPNKKA
jgi:large subunit ribosomal protein L15